MTKVPESPVLDAMRGPYEPGPVEARWYPIWEACGYFQPSQDPARRPFVIAIPPPNITGVLHHGQAMFVAYQDFLIRWQRMRGRAALWIPGTDHAAIATQNVLERLLQQEGTSRLAIGREKFVERFWAWKAHVGATINQQFRRLGASLDWTREHFTLDPDLSRAVREAFVRLYERGRIYRGRYLVNWCPADRSAISDLEVEYAEVTGHLWSLRYPLKGGGHITVATTRPETMLGDTAIAVHPDDARYRRLIGATAVVPGIGREIAIVADAAVDQAFGTGAVKVTPGHDPNDWAIAQRHGLPAVNILNADGTLNEHAGRWAGLDRFVARKNYLEYLDAEGLVERVQEFRHNVGHCSRDGAVIEPLLSEQWFVDVKPMAQKAAAAVQDGRITFFPERFAAEFLRWMDGIQPWCISRQLWLGHRIPVWYCGVCSQQIVARTDPSTCPRCNATTLTQDPDVLDTWFSSGLWPFSILGWPDDTPDLCRFYPTDVLETGYDIIFFWVARMVMLGLELTDNTPFRTVYLHGLMRHADGSKISKSNYRPGDNPIDVIDAHGADALRFMVLTGGSPGSDMRLVLERVAEAGHFGNKLWNAAKFVIGAMERTRAAGVEPAASTTVDRWILGRLDEAIADTTRLVESYQIGEAGRALYDFLWREVFDWYIEAAKIRLYAEDAAAARRVAQTLETILDAALRLLHPFLPFITEEVWHHFRRAGGAPDGPEHLIVAPLPDAVGERSRADMARVAALIEIVQGIRNARHESGVEPGRYVEAHIVGAANDGGLQAESEFIARLGRVSPLHFHAAAPALVGPAVTVRAGGVEVFLPLAGMVDVVAELARLRKERDTAQADVTRAEALLDNASFAARAPAAVVDREREKAAEARARLAQLDARIGALSR
ncbi:MAG: valine--tRNA ligase [Actinobacteria bacterium]|nr:valine--tRNA ligase [Actinomycetota bacterium]